MKRNIWQIPRGGSVLLVYSILSKVFGLLAVYLLLGHTRTDYFADYTILQSVHSLLIVIFGYAISLTVTRYTALMMSNREELISFLSGGMALIFIMSLFAVFVFLSVGHWLADVLYQRNDLSLAFKVSGLQFATSLIFEYFLSVFYGSKAFKQAGIFQLVKMIMMAILIFVLKGDPNIVHLIYGISIINILLCLVMGWSIGRKLEYTASEKVSINWPFIIEAIRNFSLPATLIVVIESVVLWYLVFLISNNLGDEAIIAYGFFEKFLGIVIFIPRILSKLTLVLVSESMGIANYDGSNIFITGLIQTILIGLILVVCMGLVSENILITGNLSFVYKSSFIVYLLVGMFQAINNYIVQSYNATGDVNRRLVYTLIWASIFLLGTSIFVISLKNLGLILLSSYIIVVVVQSMGLYKVWSMGDLN